MLPNIKFSWDRYRTFQPSPAAFFCFEPTLVSFLLSPPLHSLCSFN